MFLSIKNIPKVSWSSDTPLNLKPKISTFFFLCFGLTLFGLGEGLLIVSAAGASPWSVFAQGIYLNVGFSIGIITVIISVVVLILVQRACVVGIFQTSVDLPVIHIISLLSLLHRYLRHVHVSWAIIFICC